MIPDHYRTSETASAQKTPRRRLTAPSTPCTLEPYSKPLAKEKT